MLRFTLNGTQIEIEDGENRTLLEYLRNVKCMKGTKEACSTGHCGACSVLVDGRLTRSCVTLVHRLDGKAVETIENAPNDTMLQVIQHSFLDVGAVQCGFCTPGMVMATKALLLHHPAPTEPEIYDGLKNNYCRCTGYVKIVEAIRLAGKYPRILEDEVVGVEAQRLFKDANDMLDKLSAEKTLNPRGVVGLFPANRVGDDIEIYRDETRTHVINVSHHLRQQTEKTGFANYCLADFVAPKLSGKADYIGAFAVTGGLEEDALADAFEAQHDDYNKIMVKALADRLAEAFAEYLHERVRKVYWGYAPNENLSNEELIRENYQGIRPAPGYPACPEHTEKATIWELLEVEKHTGMKLTESFAMWPGASVSGWYFSHPDSKYYAVAQIQRDQVEDYARRKGMSVTEVERWLAPNLGYDAD